MDMKQLVLVPSDRVGVLTTDVRASIESKVGVRLSIERNAVEIEGEGMELHMAANIIKAIGRGFSPQRALRLLDEEQSLEVIDLGQLSDRRAETVKARVIGTGGKMRGRIEQHSGAAVSVYGKTITIIGNYEQIRVAREAIEMFIHGAAHSTVQRFLLRAKVK